MKKITKKSTEKQEKVKDMTVYSFEDALKRVKETAKAKFDSTIELHVNLSLDKKAEQQSVRFTTVLPHGTGKTKKVAVLASKKVANADLELSESDIDKLANSTIRPKVDFDVLIAEPRFMAKLAKAAKILGPAGVMPNPKTGTVSEDVEGAVEQVKKGKIEIRTEPNATNIHTILGKKSFEDNKLIENYKEVISSIKANKPQKAKPDWIRSIFVGSTMGPSFSVKVEL
ncbi:MAG: 50S ribosomal protein L1 [uncultured bacterium]|nr:MAG: 50S ribosomal protein L1 [uncultured bacterium]